MKPLVLIVILLVLLSSCKQSPQKKTQAEIFKEPKSTGLTAPDSSINNFLKLRNPESTPDSIKKAIKDNVVVLSTKDETRFLIAYQYPGDPLGSFIGFELAGASSDLADYPYIKTNLDQFITENGISDRSELKDILKIKGDSYYTEEKNGLTTYRYIDVPGDFLKRHNSEEYVFEVQSMDGLLTGIRFGFVPSDSTGNIKLDK